MNTRSLGHRAPLLWLVLPFACGLVAAKLSHWPAVISLLVLALIMSLASLIASRRAPRLWSWCIVIAMVLAGMGSYALHRVRLPSWEQLPPREARLTLKINRLFLHADPRRATGLATITQARQPLGELIGQNVYFSVTLRKAET